jgi:copper chaperone CopZ
MKEATLSVSGVKCGGCVAKCEAALKTVPGYVEAVFDISANSAIVRGDIDVAAVIAALAKAGYPASLKNF